MKYDASTVIKFIIHDLKQISRTVNSKSDVLIFVVIHGAVILVMTKGMQNIFPAYTMPKCRLIKLNDNFHYSI